MQGMPLPAAFFSNAAAQLMNESGEDAPKLKSEHFTPPPPPPGAFRQDHMPAAFTNMGMMGSSSASSSSMPAGMIGGSFPPAMGAQAAGSTMSMQGLSSGTSGSGQKRQADEDDDDKSDDEPPPMLPAMQMMMMSTFQQMMMNAMKLKELTEKQEEKKKESKAKPKDTPADIPNPMQMMMQGMAGMPGMPGMPAGMPAALRPDVLPAALANKDKIASTSASSTALPALMMGGANLPAAITAIAGMGQKAATGFIDPANAAVQQEALAQAAKELEAAQEAAAAQQAAFEQMTPEQQAAVYQAMSSASEAQAAQQAQFYEQLRAHEAKKLAESGYYQNHQPERFKDGYRPLRLCKHFASGNCWRGDECTYGHSFEELHPASPDLPRIEQKTETNALAEQQKVEDSAPDVRLKKKKELCRKFQNNDCVLGRACPYAHGEKELGTVELVVCGRVKTRICKFWTTGSCMFLGNCVNAHGEKELGTKRPEFITPPMKKRREGESIDQFREQVISRSGGGKGRRESHGAGNH